MVTPTVDGGRNPNHQLLGGLSHDFYRVETCFNHPFGGAGFLPSTVLTKSWESFLSPSDGNFPKSWYHEQIDQTSHQKRP